MDTILLFLIVGGGPFVVATVLGAIFASSARRTFFLVLAGLLLQVVLFVAAVLFSTPTDEGEQCHDCGEYFGRWIHPAIFVWPFFNFLAWLAGLTIGGLGRLLVTRRPATGS